MPRHSAWETSPELTNGRRYSAISASASLRNTEPGSTRSTNMFFCKIMSSPPAERKPWNARRAFSGQSSQVTGVTSASM